MCVQTSLLWLRCLSFCLAASRHISKVVMPLRHAANAMLLSLHSSVCRPQHSCFCSCCCCGRLSAAVLQAFSNQQPSSSTSGSSGNQGQSLGQSLAALTGLLAVSIVAWSEYTLKATGNHCTVCLSVGLGCDVLCYAVLCCAMYFKQSQVMAAWAFCSLQTLVAVHESAIF